jgi:hypothetical protein
MVEVGYLRQRVRAQFVHQAVGEDCIRTDQDDLRVGDAGKERHINAVFHCNALSQQHGKRFHNIKGKVKQRRGSGGVIRLQTVQKLRNVHSPTALTHGQCASYAPAPAK